MTVKKFSYREAPTPEGLKKIENGTLDYLDLEVWSNLNTGVLEEYFEEKNRREAFQRSRFVWRKVIIGIALGTIFAVITEYVGLKVGIAISGGWYIMYLLGTALRWHPCEINISAGACTGATYIGTGFIFTFPAMYLLAYSADYAMSGGTHLITHITSKVLVVTLISTILTGMLGVLYFIIFRRVWLVEDPLHIPGWEPNLQLIDISNDLYKAGPESANRAITALKNVGIWASLSGFFTFLRDFPVGGKPILDKIFGGKYYSEGSVYHPYAKYTHLDFYLIPIQFGIGWFMRFRVALLVNLGTFLTWFLIVPLAVKYNVPIYNAPTDTFYSILTLPYPALAAFAKVARPVAIGTILGGGFTGLVKMAPTFKAATQDLVRIGKVPEEERRDYVKGRGWYEWPISHIKVMIALTFVATVILFTIAGFPFSACLLFSFLLVATTFFLGAIAVKVMGETGTEPVSGTSFIVLIMLIGVFLLLRLTPEQTAILSIIGTTVFAGAISMSGDIIWDFKSGLYIGNRPYHLMKGELTGLIPGAVASTLGAIMFSQLLAKNILILPAPQANAFATIVQALVGGGPNVVMIYHFILIGIVIGVIAEFLTGMGTAFGLGMYFPFGLMIPMIIGGALRDIWEKKYLEPKVKAEGWTEKQRTLKVLDTYMIATGLIVGEAIMGTIVAIYFIFA
ncbi:MAG: hypothetical protein DRN20_05760 [Thermoplasmata archaeon]|nr:MAG: hypothetical protein DRN20_05760 [Thermoplasmata archaeon]